MHRKAQDINFGFLNIKIVHYQLTKNRSVRITLLFSLLCPLVIGNRGFTLRRTNTEFYYEIFVLHHVSQIITLCNNHYSNKFTYNSQNVIIARDL